MTIVLLNCKFENNKSSTDITSEKDKNYLQIILHTKKKLIL